MTDITIGAICTLFALLMFVWASSTAMDKSKETIAADCQHYGAMTINGKVYDCKERK